MRHRFMVQIYSTTPRESKIGNRPLSVEQMLPAIAVFGIGTTLAMISFVWERCKRRYIKEGRKKLAPRGRHMMEKADGSSY